MKQLLFIFVVIMGLVSCGNSQGVNAQSKNAKKETKEYVEVLYFHGKQRCITCKAIEDHTQEVLKQYFTAQQKNGEVVFKVIDISTKEGEKIADKYEVTWSSLFINKWKNGKETRNNMTDFGFSNAKSSPDVFKAGVKKKIDELLK